MSDQIADVLTPESTEGTAPEGQGQPIDQPPTVQPEGQGQPGGSTGLYDLSTVPEEYRSHVEQVAKEIDRNVNGKLQEYADHRKRWEPFQELGLDDVGADGIAALLDFAEALSDPDNAQQAILTLAENVGVDLGVTPAGGEGGEPGADSPEVAALKEQVTALTARLDGRDEAEVASQEKQKLNAEWNSVKEAHKASTGKDITPAEQERLRTLAIRMVDEDEPIKAAYEFITEVAGAGASQLVEAAPKAPAAAARPGQPATTVEPPDSFDEAERLMTERRRLAAAA